MEEDDDYNYGNVVVESDNTSSSDDIQYSTNCGDDMKLKMCDRTSLESLVASGNLDNFGEHNWIPK